MDPVVTGILSAFPRDILERDQPGPPVHSENPVWAGMDGESDVQWQGGKHGGTKLSLSASRCAKEKRRPRGEAASLRRDLLPYYALRRLARTAMPPIANSVIVIGSGIGCRLKALANISIV